MDWFKDFKDRQIRLTNERKEHIKSDHPEMSGQIVKITDTLMNPDVVVRSRTDTNIELFYRHYEFTPVTEKYLCIVVKVLSNDCFIITAYLTDTIKKGEVLWLKK
jgi:hypothetical protein